MFKAKVILDSITLYGKRLITVEATYPRCIHSEVLTHRDRARNSASSRAIPWKKWNDPERPELSPSDPAFINRLHPKCMMAMILSDPFVPISFGVEQKGMQTGAALSGEAAQKAEQIWLKARDNALYSANALAEMGVHKSIVNRLTEPFMWITVVMTATEWNNFFRLRCHPDAEIHFQRIAGMIRDRIKESIPQHLDTGDWHCPYLDKAEQSDRRESFLTNNLDILNRLKRISAGRCARVSYLTHDGIRDPESDVQLCARLIERGDDVLHASPLEHVGQASAADHRSGPFIGWRQFRKDFANENVEG